MADNEESAKEPSIAELLIEQNSALIQLLEGMVEKDRDTLEVLKDLIESEKEKREEDRARVGELLELLRDTGLINMLVNFLRKPRVVQDPKPEGQTG